MKLLRITAQGLPLFKEDLDLSFIKKQALKVGLKKLKGTYLEEVLEEAGLI